MSGAIIPMKPSLHMVLICLYLLYSCIADNNNEINVALILILGPCAPHLFHMFPGETSLIRNSFSIHL